MQSINAITNLDYSRFVEKFDKKILVRKNFGLKKIWFEKKSWSKKYLVQSRFETFFWLCSTCVWRLQNPNPSRICELVPSDLFLTYFGSSDYCLLLPQKKKWKKPYFYYPIFFPYLTWEIFNKTIWSTPVLWY